jgi:hypothetical protein
MSHEQSHPPQEQDSLESRQRLVRDIKRSISNTIDAQFTELDYNDLNAELGKTERIDSAVGVWEDEYVQLLRTRKNIGLDAYFEVFEVVQLIPTVKGNDHSAILRFTLDEDNGLIKRQEIRAHGDGVGPHAQLMGDDKEQKIASQDRLYEMLRIVTNLAVVPSDQAEKILTRHSQSIPLLYKTDFDKEQARKAQLRGRGVKQFIRNLLDKNDLSGEKP